MIFRQLYTQKFSSYTYLLADVATSEAIIIDPVLDMLSRDIQLLQELGFYIGILFRYACACRSYNRRRSFA